MAGKCGWQRTTQAIATQQSKLARYCRTARFGLALLYGKAAELVACQLYGKAAELVACQACGPFYPVLTGRRDNIYSYFNKALAEIP
ncbi:hypothetical protein CFP56_001002 [Quercus suber]|uniref:Uncharacterized protein n=1 Tax=Quercus suber TaxID=58331 RepID=A0AAW0LF70_QUESU